MTDPNQATEQAPVINVTATVAPVDQTKPQEQAPAKVEKKTSYIGKGLGLIGDVALYGGVTVLALVVAMFLFSMMSWWSLALIPVGFIIARTGDYLVNRKEKGEKAEFGFFKPFTNLFTRPCTA